MTKSQKRSNREVRKPKASKPKPPVGLPSADASPVLSVTRKQKGKL